MPSQDSGSDDPAREGDLIAAYRVVGLLGQGAMGRVYRAHDPRLDRFVAIKLVQPRRLAHDAAKARARLVAEARALARVSHPNVLAVYDVGVHEEAVFVAVELIDGFDLSQWLRVRERPWGDVVRLFVEAASGLAAVHDAGLVHRDVKPANILVEHAPRGRAFGRVLVADFGIAHAVVGVEVPEVASVAMAGLGSDERLTAAGHVPGTPVYMAPEQHLGHAVGPAVDQYALCVALYEGLRGMRPFSGDAPTLLQLKRKGVEPPSRSDVPGWVWAVVVRGLSPEPSDRFASMRELADALRSGASRRRRTILGLTGAGVGTAAAGGLLAATIMRPEPCTPMRERPAAVWNEGRRDAIEAGFLAGGEPGRASTWARVTTRFDRYADELATMYDETCAARVVGDASSEALFDRRIACLDPRQQAFAQALALLSDGAADVLDHADDIASSLASLAPCEAAAVREGGVAPPSAAQRAAVAEARRVRAEAELLQAAARYDDAALAAERAERLALATGYVPAQVEAQVVAAEVYERRGRIDEARSAAEAASAAGLEVGHDSYVARAAILRTWIAAEYDRDLEAAQTWAALGRTQLRRIGDPTDSALALHNALGTAYAVAGRDDDARREYEDALGRIASEPTASLDVWAATLHANLGNVQYRLGDLEAARRSYEQALAIFRARYGDEHANVASTEVRVGQILELGGRHREAITSLRRAIVALEATQAAPAELGSARVALGVALREVGDEDEAIETLARAVELLEPTEDVVSLASALVSYGSACVDQGVHDAAEVHFERAVDLLEPLDPGNPQLGSAWLGIGRIRELQARPDDALAFYRRALEAAPAGTRGVARALVAIAQVHTTAGRYDEAIRTLDRQAEVLERAPLVLADDRLSAAIARVKLLVASGDAGAPRALASIEELDRRLAESRAAGGSRRAGEGDLVLGRAWLAQGAPDVARTVLERALTRLDAPHERGLAAQARAALTDCAARP